MLAFLKGPLGLFVIFRGFRPSCGVSSLQGKSSDTKSSEFQYRQHWLPSSGDELLGSSVKNLVSSESMSDVVFGFVSSSDFLWVHKGLKQIIFSLQHVFFFLSWVVQLTSYSRVCPTKWSVVWSLLLDWGEVIPPMFHTSSLTSNVFFLFCRGEVAFDWHFGW